MTFKALKGLAPGDLSEFLTPYRLLFPDVEQKPTERAFAVAAPSLWNGLPATIRNTESLSVFKCKVKTFLF